MSDALAMQALTTALTALNRADQAYALVMTLIARVGELEHRLEQVENVS